jgi:hypothetical protein
MDKLLINKPNYFLLMFMISFGLVGFAVSAADKMSGKFFPPDSPILANYYPNDFLPAGIFLFLSLAWVSIQIICRWLEGNQQLVTIILVIIAIYLLMAYADIIWLAKFDNGVWTLYLKELLRVWAVAWSIGGIWAFYNNSLVSFIKGKSLK